MKIPKLSIIVPVYNEEKHIKSCLDSLNEQTMKGFEIIVVNDGSSDNTEQIILEYIKEHSETNIIYLKKENGGLSSARNYGVTYAKGKYISFIDSDDYIKKDLYKNLEKYMDKEIDLIKFKMQTVNEDGKIIEKISGPVFDECSGEEGYEKLCTLDKFMDPACIYLYKREFFIENNFKYELAAYHEDFGLTSLIIIKAKSFVSTDEYGYYYLQTNNSITRNDNKDRRIKKANDVLKHYDNMIDEIQTIQVSEKTKDLIKRYYTNTVILKARELTDEKQEFYTYIKEIKRRKMYKNIKPYDIKQFIKRMILKINIKLYLKIKS